MCTNITEKKKMRKSNICNSRNLKITVIFWSHLVYGRHLVYHNGWHGVNTATSYESTEVGDTNARQSFICSLAFSQHTMTQRGQLRRRCKFKSVVLTAAKGYYNYHSVELFNILISNLIQKLQKSNFTEPNTTSIYVSRFLL